MNHQKENNKILKTVNKCDCCYKSWRNNKAGGDTCNCSCSNCFELLRDCKYSCYVLKINKIEEVKPKIEEVKPKIEEVKEEYENLMKFWKKNMKEMLYEVNGDMSLLNQHPIALRIKELRKLIE